MSGNKPKNTASTVVSTAERYLCPDPQVIVLDKGRPLGVIDVGVAEHAGVPVAHQKDGEAGEGCNFPHLDA